jgi:hypothetical protein
MARQGFETTLQITRDLISTFEFLHQERLHPGNLALHGAKVP